MGSIADPVLDAIAALIAKGNIPRSNIADPLIDTVSIAALSGEPVINFSDPLLNEIEALAGATAFVITGEIQILGTQIGVGLADTGTADSLNLLQNTAAFQAVEWQSEDLGFVAADGAATDPLGGTTASSLTEAAATFGTGNGHSISQGLVLASAGGTYTFSVYLEQGHRTRAQLAITQFDWRNPPATDGVTCTFDLAGGQIGIAAAAVGTAWAIVGSPTITAKANGFYLCTLSATVGTAGATYAGQHPILFTIRADSGSGTGAANINYGPYTSGPALYAWGPKAETGGTATAYVPANTNLGAAATALVDNNLTTYWGTQTVNEVAGVDAGVSVRWTRYRFAGRPTVATPFVGPDGSLDYAMYLGGATIGTSLSPNLSSPTVTDTIPSWPNGASSPSGQYFRRYQLYERQLSVTARFIGVFPTATMNGGLAQLQFFAKYAAGIGNACPAQPTISPNGGGYPGLSATITIASLTTSANIYYVADTVSHTAAYVQANGTLYSGAFSQAITLGASVIISAVAFDATSTLSQSLSPVTVSAPFRGYGYQPGDVLYDTAGNKIDAHQGGICGPFNGFYYWAGQAMDSGFALRYGGNNDNLMLNCYGLNLYKSTDMINWQFVNTILPARSAQVRPERCHILYNAVNNNFVLWCHEMTYTAGGTHVVAQTSGNNIETGWSWHTSYADSNDIGIFLDSDGVSAYLLYEDGAHFYVAPLASDYLSYTTPTSNSFLQAYEAYGMVKHPVYGTYFLIFSEKNIFFDAAGYPGRSNLYYAYLPGQTTPAATGSWLGTDGGAIASGNLGTLFDFTPATPNFAFANQGTSIISNGLTMPVYLGDHWDQGLPDLGTSSRNIFLPLVFPNATSVQLQSFAQWTPSVGSPSGITFVQANKVASAGSTNSQALAFISNNTAGNFIVASIVQNVEPATLSISDTQGNIWTIAQFMDTTSGHNGTIAIAYAANIKAGANTITVGSTSSGGSMRIAIHEFSGSSKTTNATLFDKWSNTIFTSGSGTLSTPSITPTNNGALLFAYSGGSANLGAAPTWPFIGGELINPSNMSAYYVQPAAASISCKFNLAAGTITDAHPFIAAFNP